MTRQEAKNLTWSDTRFVKHEKVIKAYAEGAEVQMYVSNHWEGYSDGETPGFNECFQYRIKPKPDPYIVFEEAQKAGKTIQWYYTREWIDCPCDVGSWSRIRDANIENLRIKPEPKYRAWRPEEVPIGALLRAKQDSRNIPPVLILGVILNYGNIDRPALTFNGNCGANTDHYYLNDAYISIFQIEHSRDNGKTWLPCRVEVKE